MVSFKIDKQLQTISNYFLFSLAVADLIIGAFSVPLFAVMYIKKSWIFSRSAQIEFLPCFYGFSDFQCLFIIRHFCDAWLAIDYLASNASVWNLMVIFINCQASGNGTGNGKRNGTPFQGDDGIIRGHSPYSRLLRHHITNCSPRITQSHFPKLVPKPTTYNLVINRA